MYIYLSHGHWNCRDFLRIVFLKLINELIDNDKYQCKIYFALSMGFFNAQWYTGHFFWHDYGCHFVLSIEVVVLVAL